jgi:UDP-N-acetylenolpyruvoylglucosamine reductase
VKELLDRRSATQPLQLPNAGSVFRNPPDTHAARLIQEAGLKGLTVGGALVGALRRGRRHRPTVPPRLSRRRALALLI